MTQTNPTPAMIGKISFTPMQIAEHRLFTAKEKLDFLSIIKAELNQSGLSSADLGFEPGEVDQAIDAVRLAAQTGAPVSSVIWGEN